MLGHVAEHQAALRSDSPPKRPGRPGAQSTSRPQTAEGAARSERSRSERSRRAQPQARGEVRNGRRSNVSRPALCPSATTAAGSAAVRGPRATQH